MAFPPFRIFAVEKCRKSIAVWNGTEFKIFYETVFSFLYSCLHKLGTFLLNVDSGQDLLKFRFLNSCSNPQGLELPSSHLSQ